MFALYTDIKDWDPASGFTAEIDLFANVYETQVRYQPPGSATQLAPGLAPMLIHDEPIRRDGEIVGRITSGAFGHTVGASVGMGYVALPRDAIGRPLAEYAASGRFEIEIAADCFPATAAARPFYDPSGARLRL